MSDELARDKLRAILKVADHVFDFLKLATKALIWIFYAISAVRIAEAVAGQSTELDISGEHDILVSFWSGIDISCRWAWALVIVAVAYGWMQSRLRRRKTKYLSDRIRGLEEQIDPNRTSSGLTKAGDTPKGG